MPVRIVQSKQNARLKDLRRALARPGREPLVAIEGPILIAEARRAGVRLLCVFGTPESQPLLDSLHLPSETDILLFPQSVLDAELTTENPQSVAALIEPRPWSWEQLLKSSGSPLILVLAGLQDPGNLGTILRSAEAFGATGIVCLPGTVSEWNPKALRASAGSILRIPLIHASANDTFDRLRKAKIKILATTARKADTADSIDLAKPVAFLIGNEGNGLSPELAAQAQSSITIPCPGPVESLNAAIATSVLLYEAARQRTARKLKGGLR